MICLSFDEATLKIGCYEVGRSKKMIRRLLCELNRRWYWLNPGNEGNSSQIQDTFFFPFLFFLFSFLLLFSSLSFFSFFFLRGRECYVHAWACLRVVKGENLKAGSMLSNVGLNLTTMMSWPEQKLRVHAQLTELSRYPSGHISKKDTI